MASGVATYFKLFIVAVQIVKLIINCAIVIIYRRGDDGEFLGASHNKNHDMEAFVCTVFIGFLIFNIAQLLSNASTWLRDRNSINKPVHLDIILNGIGFMLWLSAGACTLQYWTRHVPGNHFIKTTPNIVGKIMGALAIINCAFYLTEIILTYMNIKLNSRRSGSSRRNRGQVYTTANLNSSINEKEMKEIRE